MFTRQKTHKVMVGKVQIGHQNKVVIQSMTNTKTSDVTKTLKQITALHAAGCQLVRATVLDEADVIALKTIVKKAPCPIIADIHYSDKFAIEAIKAGVAKIRINPGNIALNRLKIVVTAAKKYHAAI
ncbi:MAG: flavodoxin-dependent (E)-4-hydroxy-3-methylbut-2-enyl-diphosphate synthase, partial [Mycoplasmataceae bacterium]|nr:flavodoxin-dependent (E)-4-hydroxy-3-methylbut-2-enyl-diphosphate synthase [Mycoplasmataceae bacterium]